MKKTRLLTLLLVISFIMLATTVSYAQATGKVAVINSQRAFEQSIEGKKAIAQFQERDTKIKSDLQKMDDAIRTLENKLNTGRLTMTQDALIALNADIEKKKTEQKRYQEDVQADSQKFQANIVNKLRTEMISLIAALRKEKGFDVVFDLASAGVVDFDAAIDITDDVVRRYDATKTAGTTPIKH